MSVISDAYYAISDLNLWIKVEQKDPMTIADIPSILKYRFNYIKDSWSQIKLDIISNLNSYSDPDRLSSELKGFDAVIEATRGSNPTRPSDSSLIADYYSVFDNISIGSTALTKEENSIVTSEIIRVGNFKRNDFLTLRKKMAAGRDYVSDIIGGADEDFNKVYGRKSASQLLNKTIPQINLSRQFQLGINAIDTIIANSSILKPTSGVDPFAFAKQNANNPNFNIQSYNSGNLVRLNFGESLQTLAHRTLGDQDRWIDIAIANNLKPPYIDEIGEKISLISNGNGNRINIGKYDLQNQLNIQKLYINQIVILQSTVENSPDQRSIVNIIEIPVSGEIVIELSGEANLDIYKVQDLSHIRVFKPNTINSNFFILIPSSEPLPPSVGNDTPWFLKAKGEDEKRAGVDLFLSETGDLNFSGSGDIQLSYGKSNALQALKILLSTEEGGLFRHEGYGVKTNIGSTTESPEQIRAALVENITSKVLNDPRFDRLDFIDVAYSNDTYSGFVISLGVVLSGGGSVIPISFSVNPPN
jgi:hypothetical protein